MPQQILRAGLADELNIGIVAVLFGDGLRFLENLGDHALRLEETKLLESPDRTDIMYRVIK